MLKHLSFLIFFLLFSSLVQAAEPEDLKITVSPVEEFTRIKIYCSQPANFSINSNDSKIDVNFLDKEFKSPPSIEMPAGIKLRNITLNDGHLVSIETLGANYSVRKFVSEDFVGIDIKYLEEVATPTPTAPKKEVTTATEKKPGPLPKEFLTIEKGVNGDIWNFNWENPVATSVFMRGGILWIAFDKTHPIDLKKFRVLYPNISISQMTDNEHLILRTTAPYQNIVIGKNANSWQIFFNKSNSKDSSIRELVTDVVKTDSSYAVKATNLANIIHLSDPDIGDELSIIPTSNLNLGVKTQRKFVSFQILPSFQGIAINHLADHLQISSLAYGVEIIPAPVANVIADVQTHEKKLESKDETPNFTKQRRGFELNILNSKKEERVSRLKDFAEFLYKENMFYESNSIIEKLKLTAPTQITNEIKLLSVSNQFMLNKYVEAEETLESLSFGDLYSYQKVLYSTLKNAIDFYVSAENKNINFAANSLELTKSHPSRFLEKLALIDIEDLIDKFDYKNASNLVTTLETESHPEFFLDNLEFFKAKIAKLNANQQKALNIWTQLSKKIENKRIRAMSSYELVLMLDEDEKIANEDIIKRLETIRYYWRGDNIESDILKKLAETYKLNNDFVNSLRTYKYLISYFPTSGETLTIAAEMSKLFVDIFSQDGIAKDMDDFHSTSLYYEFRELTPIGEVGDNIIKSLITKLTNLDLLDQATALLDHQVRFRFKGLEKMTSSNKLALLYLENKQPEKAIEILKFTDEDEFVEDYIDERTLLLAKSYIDMNNLDEAMKILNFEYSDLAEDLKIEIYFKQNDWIRVIDGLERRVRSDNININKINDVDKSNILRLGIAYSMIKDFWSIKTLENLYEPALKDNPDLKETLGFLGKENNIDHKDLKNSVSLDNFQAFMNKIKTQIK